MQTAVQVLLLYAALGFVPVIIARVGWGVLGARSMADLVFRRAPAWLITETISLVAGTLRFFFRPRLTGTAFAPEPVPTEEPMPSQSQPSRPLSLAERMRQRNQEELNLIRRLSTYPHLEEHTLKRAFELELIDHIAVQQQETPHGPSVSRSFVLRAPVSTRKADDVTANPKETTDAQGQGPPARGRAAADASRPHCST